MVKRWIQRLDSFRKALNSLAELLESQTSIDDIIIDAGLQRFEVTYKLAWKTIQDYLYEQG